MELPLNEMYAHSADVSSKWIELLFPSNEEGCINFGYWKNIDGPITLEQRINSQKNLYLEIFHRFPTHCDKVLEVGCGRGHGVAWARELGFESYGIDILVEQIEKCKKNYPTLSSFYSFGKAEQIPFADSAFDCIYTVEAAQHFSCFDAFCRDAFRVLKNRGKLVITTFFFKDDTSIKKTEKLIPNNIEGFHNAIVLENAIKLMEKNGFSIEKKPLPIGDHVFSRYAEWHKMQLGNNNPSELSENRKEWASYYTGGGNGHHPWRIAFEEKLIDYYIIEGIKE